MSTQGSTALEKAEVHTESLQQVQPIDLASRNAGGQVVQLRPVRAFSTAHVTAKSVGGPTGVGGLTAVNAPIISVNRPGNLTLLPTRAGTVTTGQPAGGTAHQVTQAISTYQIARVGNMRSATLATGQQPASITVTPISASNFSANIRLTGATVNNGSWIQTNSGGPGNFGPSLRAATITVGGRPVRPETAKMIHIPNQGSVQHVAQLQMVDGKGSLLKPSITTTPLVNIRGALQGGANAQSVTLPIAPFTIRTANIANLPTIQQRPQTSTTNTGNQVQKVIAQPPHGAPIQFVNATNKNVLQAITTPLPRLNVNAVNAVCLTLSTNAATLAPNSSSPIVAVASKQGATGLIMTPSLAAGTIASGLPITKVIPVGRDGSASIVDSLFAQPNPSTSNAVTVSAVSASGTQVSNNTGGHGHGHNITSPNVVLAASPSITTHGASNNSSVSISQSQHFVQLQGPINVHPANAQIATGVGLPPGMASAGSIGSGYFVDKGNLSLLQTTTHGRSITLEKRTSDGKSIAAGSMILTTQHPHIQSGGQGATVTFPIAAGHQHVSFAHPLSMSHSSGQHQLPSSAQIIATPISAQAHHISSSVLSTMSSTPTISVSAASSQHMGYPGGGGLPHSIPTHVISQPQSGHLSIGSSASNLLGNISVTTTSACNSVSVTNPGNMPCSSVISVGENTFSLPANASLPTTSSSSMSTTTTTSCTMNSNSLSTAAPAQSPNTKSTTHSPRPSILRKQREFGDNHHIPPRSQRNLTLQLNYTGNNNTNSSSSSTANITSASSVAATTTSVANKENAGGMERGPPGGNNNGNTSSSVGLSILRKEFQPPTEESSWQSCSSHSSGSTTISATSETAEFQMNQGQSSNTSGGGVDITVNVPLNCESGSGSNSVPPSSCGFGGNSSRGAGAGSTSTAISQNGVVRSITSSGSQGRGVHRNSSSKLQNRDIERIKRDKEDNVSPRKKPRKQQLTTSDFIEAASPEISFYQGRGKFRRMENNIFDGYSQSNKTGVDPSSMEDSTPPKVVCVIKRPRMTLLSNQTQQSGKTRLNHFEHYSEVKAKEERRPTIAELANQKNINQKVSGWKIQHMTKQMEQVVELEVSVVNSFNSLLTRLENKVGSNCPDRDINRILELLKGNIQRCKVIRDQMSESKQQALRILDHKPRIVDVISKHMTKKPQKRKDRL